MFKCGQCGTQSKRGETPIRVVVEERVKTYPHSKHQRKEQPTTGREIVKEQLLCQTCVDGLEFGKPDDVDPSELENVGWRGLGVK